MRANISRFYSLMGINKNEKQNQNTPRKEGKRMTEEFNNTKIKGLLHEIMQFTVKRFSDDLLTDLKNNFSEREINELITEAALNFAFGNSSFKDYLEFRFIVEIAAKEHNINPRLLYIILYEDIEPEQLAVFHGVTEAFGNY